MRDVVEKGVRANPGHAAAIRKEGRDLCANYLIKRWDAANEEKQGHVRAKLERWRERLENHDAETVRPPLPRPLFLERDFPSLERFF